MCDVDGRPSLRARRVATSNRRGGSRRKNQQMRFDAFSGDGKSWKGILSSDSRLIGSKLADWDDDDIPKQAHGRWAKVVILRYMFTLQELEDDPAALIELKEDVREECEKIGGVSNVVLFDAEPDGIMSVRFADEEDANECVKVQLSQDNCS